jgi:hypothetical protein
VFQRRRWKREEEELAEWSVKHREGAHVYFMVLSRAPLRKLRLLPVNRGTDFDKLVVLTIDGDVDLMTGPPPAKLAEIAHTVYHSRLVLAGSRVAQGPYGDLFYRVLAAYGCVLDAIGMHKHGAQPAFDEQRRVEAPTVREFLEAAGRRFAGALGGTAPSTAQGFVPTLQSLAAELGNDPPLIAALVRQTPAAERIHRPNPGWSGSFAFGDFLDATGDSQLSRELADAAPV